MTSCSSPQKVYKFLLLASFFAMVMYSSCHAWSDENNNVTQCAESEREALLNFKKGINIDHCRLLDSWVEDRDCCKWRGVKCDSHSGHVTSLLLHGHVTSLQPPAFPDISYYDHLPCLEVATVIGTLVAYWLVPMRSLGADSWKIAAALMGSYIGGALNYIAVSEALGVSPSIVAAGVAADNLICAIYFMVLFALASRVPPEAPKPTTALEECSRLKSADKLPVLPAATGIAVSFAICKLSAWLAKFIGLKGGVLPIATAVIVSLATALPQAFSYLAPSGDAMSLILMQVFFAVIGASGSIWNVINTAPFIFLFALIQVTVHLAIVLGLGKMFRIELKLLLLASNANVGGPTTACGMATTKGWDELVVPGILAGIFGISIATFLAIGLALTVLKYM